MTLTIQRLLTWSTTSVQLTDFTGYSRSLEYQISVAPRLAFQGKFSLLFDTPTFKRFFKIHVKYFQFLILKLRIRHFFWSFKNKSLSVNWFKNIMREKLSTTIIGNLNNCPCPTLICYPTLIWYSRVLCEGGNGFAQTK